MNIHQYTELLKQTSLLQASVCLPEFARIHKSSFINIEKILNRPITKFYNDDDVNVIAAELWPTKMRPTSFYITRT